MTHQSPLDYFEKVIPVMRQTRDILLPEWGKAKAIHQKDDSPLNVVTKLDIQIEEVFFQFEHNCDA